MESFSVPVYAQMYAVLNKLLIFDQGAKFGDQSVAICIKFAGCRQSMCTARNDVKMEPAAASHLALCCSSDCKNHERVA